MTRRAAKTDRNQAEIVATLRAAGYIVDLTHRLGGGFPDIIVWSKTTPRLAVPMEIKTRRGTLTPDEQEWHAQHDGSLVVIVRSAEAALQTMALVDREARVG